MALNLQHQTVAEFTARLRDKWRAASKDEKGKLADRMYNLYQDGDVTAAQFRTAFGMSAAQFTDFAARLQALRANWLAVQAEGPE